MHAKVVQLVTIVFFASMAFGQPPADESTECVFYLNHTEVVQDIQEIATVVRGIANVSQASTDAAQRTLMVRGTTGQIALAAWLFSNLDQPTDTRQKPDASTQEYHVADSDNVVRVFYLTHTATVRNLQEVATTVRSLGEIRRLFTFNALSAVAARGTPGQIALAGWLLNELDQSTNPQRAQGSAIPQFRLTGNGDDVVRVFYLTHSGTVASFQKIATQVRTTSQIRRLFTYNEPRAVAVRGTDDQIAMADKLFKELDR
jgi:hypothetical protein